MQPKDSVSEDAEFEEKRKQNGMLMDRECGTLLLEVDRLERSRKMMESRLKNVMDLVGFLVFIRSDSIADATLVIRNSVSLILRIAEACKS